MKLTVSIITYNHEKYIAQAIESVLMQQTNFDFEILIGEDESSDNTRAIVKQYKEQYPDKIRLFLNDRKNVIYINGSPTGRWNFINNLKNAQGQYIALLDGDDYWTDPFKLQKQVDFLDANPDFAICFHNVLTTHSAASSFNEDHLSNSNNKDVFTTEDILEKWFIMTCSIVFRNNLIKEFPKWYMSVSFGDWPLQALLTKYGKVKYLDEVMGVYRKHNAGAGGTYTWEKLHINTIFFLKNINKEFDYKYNKLIKGIISEIYCKRAVYFYENKYFFKPLYYFIVAIAYKMEFNKKQIKFILADDLFSGIYFKLKVLGYKKLL